MLLFPICEIFVTFAFVRLAKHQKLTDMQKNILAKMALAFTAISLCACSAPKQESGRDFDPPIMGWSSWNHFHTEISEDIIVGQADALIRLGLSDAGYKYVNIDDGFTDGRGEDGRIRIDTVKFPNGMKAVADSIHARGLKAGMYSDAGDNTCASLNVKPYGLGVGLYGHEYEDCKMMFDEWGYDFFKVDNCGGRHLDLDEKSQFTKIAEAIAAGMYSSALRYPRYITVIEQKPLSR